MHPPARASRLSLVVPACLLRTTTASLVLLAALSACGGGGGDAPPGPTATAGSDACNAPVSMSDFGSDGRIGNKWNGATRTIAFGRMQPDGHFHTFLSAADGSNERRVTFSAWRDDRHQFPSSWHPSGAYLAMLVEKNDHEGSSLDAIPGYGAYTDYWLVTPDGTQAWKLYDLPAGYDHAITHAAFSPDGSKFIWSERIRAPQIFDPNLFAGSYVFNVADFDLRLRLQLDLANGAPASATRKCRTGRRNRVDRRRQQDDRVLQYLHHQESLHSITASTP